MMNPLHLLWIVPLSAAVGLVIAAFCNVANEDNDDDSDNPT